MHINAPDQRVQRVRGVSVYVYVKRSTRTWAEVGQRGVCCELDWPVCKLTKDPTDVDIAAVQCHSFMRDVPRSAPGCLKRRQEANACQGKSRAQRFSRTIYHMRLTARANIHMRQRRRPLWRCLLRQTRRTLWRVFERCYLKQYTDVYTLLTTR